MRQSVFVGTGISRGRQSQDADSRCTRDEWFMPAFEQINIDFLSRRWVSAGVAVGVGSVSYVLDSLSSPSQRLGPLRQRLVGAGHRPGSKPSRGLACVCSAVSVRGASWLLRRWCVRWLGAEGVPRPSTRWQAWATQRKPNLRQPKRLRAHSFTCGGPRDSQAVVAGSSKRKRRRAVLGAQSAEGRDC